MSYLDNVADIFLIWAVSGVVIFYLEYAKLI